MVDLEIGVSADEGLKLGDGGLQITQVGAKDGSVARPFGDKGLLFDAVLGESADTDLLISPIAGGVELFDQLRSENSPETLRFRLDLPEGTVLRTDGAGGAVAATGDGTTVVSIPEPHAVDAQGTPVPVILEVEGDTIVLQVPHRGEEFAAPILVDPEVLTDSFGWSSGNNIGAIENENIWHWESNDNSQIEHRTSCIYSCFEGTPRGLYMSTKNVPSPATIPAGAFGQWYYVAPGSTTYIPSIYPTPSAVLSPFNRDNHGCSWESYRQPHDYDGVWTGTGWAWLETERAQWYGNDTIYTKGKVLVAGIGTGGSPISIPCWRDLRLGGVSIWLTDPEPPTNSTPSVADTWIDGSATPVSVSASDPGLGVKYFKLYTTNSSGAAETLIGSAEYPCSGLSTSTCPPSWATQISNYAPASLPNGINTMVGIAYDALGSNHASQGYPFFLKVDHSPPVIDLSGELLSEHPLKYHLAVTGTDGNASSFATAQSGMKQLKFYFDGQYAGRFPEEPENPPACTSMQQGINVGSCKFENVGVDLNRTYTGKHSLRVVAIDSLNHTSERTVELNLPPDTTAPQIVASGALHDAAGGWVNAAESSVGVEALDSETGVTEESVYVDGKQAGSTVHQECFYGGCSLTHSFSVSLSGYSEGTHTVKVVAKDGAGNTAESSWSVKVDGTAPTLNSISAPEVPDGWTPQLSTFTLNYSASDSGAGVKKVEVIRPSVGGGTLTSVPYSSTCTGSASAPCSGTAEGSTSISTAKMAQGADTVTVKAYDAFNHVSNIRTLTVYVDRSAPSVSATGPLVSATSGTLVGLTSDLSITAKDGGSGVDSLELLLDGETVQTLSTEEVVEDGGSESCTGETCELTYSFSPIVGEMASPGVHTFALVADDGAGHSASISHEVTLDTKPPDLSLSGSLTEAVGEPLPTEAAVLEAVANDGAGEFASGIKNIEVEVDGNPVRRNGDLWAVDENNHRVEQFNEHGEFLLSFGTAGTGDGQFGRPTGVALDADGKVWVTDAGNNRIEEFNEKGGFIRAAGLYGSGNGQFSRPEGIAVDVKGDIWVADTGNGRLEKLDGEGHFLEAVGTKGSGSGQLGEPVGIDIAGGKIWVTDWQNNRVSEFTEAGEFVRQFGSYGTANGQFSGPYAVAVDGKGEVWVGDQHNNRVQEFNQNGEFVTKFGATGSGVGQFNFGKKTMGLTTDANGNIWVDDAANNRVQKWTIPSYLPMSNPTYASAFGSYGTSNGQFNLPTDVARDGGGNVWVVDRSNNRIEKFNEKGEYLSQFGSYGSGNGQFNRPMALAIDSHGNVWVADSYNNRVEEFNEKGEFLKSIGAEGTGNGQFHYPEGIVADARNNLWVSDSYNGRLEEFNEKGEFLKVVSSKGSGTGQLGEPTGIDVGPAGNIWVTDWQNNRVSEFTEAGEFVRQFGSYGTANGQFSGPDAIVVDSKNDIWVGDQRNNRVEEFNQNGEYVAKFGSIGSGEGQFSLGKKGMGFAADTKGDIWITDSGNNRIQKWVNPNYAPTYISAFGTYGTANGQFSHPASIVAATSDACSQGACSREESRAYTYSQVTWGPGIHQVVVTATDAAGNTDSKEVRVNESLSAVAPECTAANTQTVSGGEARSAAAVVSAIETALPTAVAPSEPVSTESEVVIDPGVTRTPEAVSLDEQGIDVVGSAMGGGVGDETAGSFTVAQAICMQPLESSSNAGPPNVVNGSAVIYPNALPDTDTVIRPTALGTDVVEYLRGPEAPESFSWAIDLQPDEELVQLSNGAIAVAAPNGFDLESEEVPADPIGSLTTLNHAGAQVAQEEHDVTVANNEISGEVRAVIAQPEVILNSGEIVPGILKVSGGTVVVAELPPNTVAEAEALVIRANPPAEPEDICASTVAKAPGFYSVVCGDAVAEAVEAEDSGDNLTLESLTENVEPVLGSTIQSSLNHYENAIYPFASASEAYNTHTNAERRFCAHHSAECLVFYKDSLAAAELEGEVFNVPSGSYDTRANALRHSLWTALMSEDGEEYYAGLALALAHEGNEWRSHKPSVRKASRMDILNDYVGFLRGGESHMASCEGMLHRVGGATYIGGEVDPFVWKNREHYEFQHLVFRKRRDYTRPGATGRVVVRNGRTCAETLVGRILFK